MAVDLEPIRLVVGLAIALLLIGVAGTLVRRVDWSPPSEATAPPDPAVHSHVVK